MDYHFPVDEPFRKAAWRRGGTVIVMFFYLLSVRIKSLSGENTNKKR